MLMNSTNSPEAKMVINLLQGNNVSAEQLVRTICSKRGINVDDFMAQLK